MTCQEGVEPVSVSDMSSSAREIIRRYRQYKDKHEAFFAGIEAYSRLDLETYSKTTQGH